MRINLKCNKEVYTWIIEDKFKEAVLDVLHSRIGEHNIHEVKI